MSRHRFFLTADWREGPLPLSVSDLHHAVSVLRLAAGNEIVAVSPSGEQLLVRLTDVGREALGGEAVGVLETEREPLVVLVQGVAKGARMDLAIQKSVEIGVSAVVPVLTERSVVRLDGEKRFAKGERWRKIAAEAAKQAQRASIPRVFDPIDLSKLPESPGGARDLIVMWEDAQGGSIGAALEALESEPEQGVAVLVGPEGGLTSQEVSSLVVRGAAVATLGGNVLRSESAGIVAVTLSMYELGGLGR